MRRRPITRSLPLLALLGAAACDAGEGPAGLAARDVAGQYELRRVDGQGVPFTYEVDATFRREIRAAVYLLVADGRFVGVVERRTVHLASGSAAIESDPTSGAFAVRGDSVRFVDATTGATARADVRGDTLRVGFGARRLELVRVVAP